MELFNVVSRERARLANEKFVSDSSADAPKQQCAHKPTFSVGATNVVETPEIMERVVKIAPARIAKDRYVNLFVYKFAPNTTNWIHCSIVASAVFESVPDYPPMQSTQPAQSTAVGCIAFGSSKVRNDTSWEAKYRVDVASDGTAEIRDTLLFGYTGNEFRGCGVELVSSSAAHNNLVNYVPPGERPFADWNTRNGNTPIALGETNADYAARMQRIENESQMALKLKQQDASGMAILQVRGCEHRDVKWSGVTRILTVCAETPAYATYTHGTRGTATRA